MNQSSERILRELLTEEVAWNSKDRSLRYGNTVDILNHRREFLFYSEVYFPRMARLFRTLVFLGALKEDDLETLEWDNGEEYPWPAEADVADRISSRMEKYFYWLTWQKGWEWEEPDKEEILALGIRPSLVPSKEYEDGTVQRSMF